MSESNSSQDKTQQPTPKKLLDARKKGQSIRSRELNTMIMLVVSSLTLVMVSGPIASGIQEVFQLTLKLDRRVLFTDFLVMGAITDSILTMLYGLMPFAILMIIAAFAGPLLLGGWSFSLDSLKPKMSRMNPGAGLKRMFGAQGFIEMIKALAKFLVIGGVSVFLLGIYKERILSLGGKPVVTALQDGLTILGVLLLILSFSLILIAMIDVPYQIISHTNKLKMSHQEVKEESKQTNGNPEIKSRIRNLQREVSQRHMLKDTKDADVVIVNPTHYSVAIKYDMSGNSAPRVVAKGLDFMAIRIREVAIGSEVAIFSAPLLARSLFHFSEVDDEIPEDLYFAVAQVLAYVYQLKELEVSKRRHLSAPEKLNLPRHYHDSDRVRHT